MLECQDSEPRAAASGPASAARLGNTVRGEIIDRARVQSSKRSWWQRPPQPEWVTEKDVAVRVMMVTQFYPPFIGGEERHVQNLATGLAQRGHRVSVVTLSGRGEPAYERAGDLHIYRISGTTQRLTGVYSDPDRRHVTPFPDPELTLALARVAKRERPDIVHGHNWMMRSYLPLKNVVGAKTVLSLHDHSHICPNKRLLFRGAVCSGPGLFKCMENASRHYGPVKGSIVALSQLAIGPREVHFIDLFIPVSQAVAQDNQLHAGEGVEVIPNFIPDSLGVRSAPLAPLPQPLPTQPFYLFVGAIGRYKGVDVLLRAHHAAGSAADLALIGYTSSEDPIDMTDLPPRTHFYTEWPHAAVGEAWSRSLFAVVPSLVAEASPTVALEAMAFGRPVVASAIGGLPELVDGETGILVPPGDVDALANAIHRLSRDARLRARLGEAGRARVDEFRGSAVIARIEAAYVRLLRSGPTARPD